MRFIWALFLVVMAVFLPVTMLRIVSEGDGGFTTLTAGKLIAWGERTWLVPESGATLGEAVFLGLVAPLACVLGAMHLAFGFTRKKE